MLSAFQIPKTRWEDDLDVQLAPPTMSSDKGRKSENHNFPIGNLSLISYFHGPFPGWIVHPISLRPLLMISSAHEMRSRSCPPDDSHEGRLEGKE